MKFKDGGSAVTLWLSASDTDGWANGSLGNGKWPLSYLQGKRVKASWDASGLFELTVNGSHTSSVSSDEFNACTSDFLATVLDEDHPVWFVAVGQFR